MSVAQISNEAPISNYVNDLQRNLASEYEWANDADVEVSVDSVRNLGGDDYEVNIDVSIGYDDGDGWNTDESYTATVRYNSRTKRISD